MKDLKIRANEQPTLLCMHTLWAREHNQVCDELGELFPEWEDEQLYQTARAIVISEYQSIVYSEWLSILFGPGEADPNDYSYSDSVDPSIEAFFSTVSFRFGHSMVPTFLWRLGKDGSQILLPLREGFFKPSLVENNGIDDFLRGASLHVAMEVDSKAVDEIRNFLFNEEADTPEMDLITLNIQRGRDMGIPSYNQARDAYGLKVLTSFDEISSNEFVWKTIEQIYEGDIDKVDAFVGGLAEDKFGGSELGELFFTANKDQFIRMRDGDRFFYKGLQWDDILLERYGRLQDILDDKVRLADVITRNTEVTNFEMSMDSRSTVFQIN